MVDLDGPVIQPILTHEANRNARVSSVPPPKHGRANSPDKDDAGRPSCQWGHCKIFPGHGSGRGVRAQVALGRLAGAPLTEGVASSTLKSWSRERRVVAKAEWTQGEANPRFVVTSLKPEAAGARWLYEKLYCARGDMENRIKECQLDPFADLTSTATMRANQLRLWFASFAYVLICALRRIALKHTQFAKANCATIRIKLIKSGALVRVSVRRIKLAMASSFPNQREYRIAHARLAAAAR